MGKITCPEYCKCIIHEFTTRTIVAVTVTWRKVEKNLFIRNSEPEI